jgi:hypothetical protein
MNKDELKDKVKTIVLNSKDPIDVNTIAKQVGCAWFTIFRTLMEIFIEELEEKSPEVFEGLDIRPLKTTKSLVFIPQK